MSDIFSDTEIQESTESYDEGNCPPGHYISITHGGKGHWDGDGCCNSSPTAPISFIIPFLLITAILIVVFSTKKLKVYDESF